MLNNRLEEEVRKILITKSDKSNSILSTPVKLNDLKEGESTKRFIKNRIVEYVRYKNEIYSNEFSNEKNLSNIDQTDTNESLLSTPNYDSGWVSVTSGAGSNYDFYHNLNTQFLFIVGYFRYMLGSYRVFNLNLHSLSDEDQGSNASHGLSIHMKTNDIINIGIADDFVFNHDNTATFGGSYKEIDSGDIRLFCWKFNPISQEN